jgi:copper homeostasis protein
MPNTSSKYVLEIACFDVESCLLAQNAGANRIEFCSNYSLGGITPNHNDILKARELIQIPLHVIIRPRGGDFCYSIQEVEIMKHDILFCEKNKIDGVVFGVLNNKNQINYSLNSELIELAKKMNTTFHRAIDECIDVNKSFNQLIELGFSHVLTSGGKGNAEQNYLQLKETQSQFGEKIQIISGGGVRSYNIDKILNNTSINQFHSAAITDLSHKVDVNEIKLLLEKLV